MPADFFPKPVVKNAMGFLTDDLLSERLRRETSDSGENYCNKSVAGIDLLTQNSN